MPFNLKAKEFAFGTWCPSPFTIATLGFTENFGNLIICIGAVESLPAVGVDRRYK